MTLNPEPREGGPTSKLPSPPCPPLPPWNAALLLEAGSTFVAFEARELPHYRLMD